mgnify:CR=1 FL=1
MSELMIEDRGAVRARLFGDFIDAAKAIRELAGPLCATPIVAMTSSAIKGDREKCIESGMDDYVAKPVRPEEVRKIFGKTGIGFCPDTAHLAAAGGDFMSGRMVTAPLVCMLVVLSRFEWTVPDGYRVPLTWGTGPMPDDDLPITMTRVQPSFT